MRGQQQVGLAVILRTDLPHTRAAFRAGRIDAFRATLVARETAYRTIPGPTHTVEITTPTGHRYTWTADRF